MEELKNRDRKGISTKKKIGKTTYEVVVHFNENATETMQDKLTRIMLREFRRKSNEKKMILIKKSLTSCYRKNILSI
ncbi:transposon-encoded TnpW family protein [Parvimonas sp. D2]|uniref:transposon-encoded TnpW family protein n=1 Tax=unclassified Parvimonas TaxID=1151464 RepID=UPI002B4A9B38|nr:MULTISPECIES: transposon-encoded TnpW family protein [unclassified Parvimonas]MEB3011840.1 transposon-encoded TnpW family protein [Parvimonas sp. D2]MEB3087332.1 transposon-encoded TnpW family protein [Parvimonas sp. D4]